MMLYDFLVERKRVSDKKSYNLLKKRGSMMKYCQLLGIVYLQIILDISEDRQL